MKRLIAFLFVLASICTSVQALAADAKVGSMTSLSASSVDSNFYFYVVDTDPSGIYKMSFDELANAIPLQDTIYRVSTEAELTTAIAAGPNAIIVVADITLSAAHEVPAGTKLSTIPGAVITTDSASGFTLTYASGSYGPGTEVTWQCFAGDGVVFTSGARVDFVRPEWWDDGSGIAALTTAMQIAVNTLVPVGLESRDYSVNDIVMPRFSAIFGLGQNGHYGARILTNGTTGISITPDFVTYASSFVAIRNLTIYDNATTTTGIKINYAYFTLIEDVMLQGFSVGLELDKSLSNKIYKLYAIGCDTAIKLGGQSSNHNSFRDIKLQNGTTGILISPGGGTFTDNLFDHIDISGFTTAISQVAYAGTTIFKNLYCENNTSGILATHGTVRINHLSTDDTGFFVDPLSTGRIIIDNDSIGPGNIFVSPPPIRQFYSHTSNDAVTDVERKWQNAQYEIQQLASGTNITRDSDIKHFRFGSYHLKWREYDLTTDSYIWTASGSGTNEYYLEVEGGGNPNLNEPAWVKEGSSKLTPGTLGSLSASEWGWGDNDSLGYDTVYVRLSTGADPDTGPADVTCYMNVPIRNLRLSSPGWASGGGTTGQDDPIGGTDANLLESGDHRLSTTLAGYRDSYITCQAWVKIVDTDPGYFELIYLNGSTTKKYKYITYSGATDWHLISMTYLNSAAASNQHQFWISVPAGSSVVVWNPSVMMVANAEGPVPLIKYATTIFSDMNKNGAYAYGFREAIYDADGGSVGDVYTCSDVANASSGYRAYNITVIERISGCLIYSKYVAILDFTYATTGTSIALVSTATQGGFATRVTVGVSASGASTNKQLTFTLSDVVSYLHILIEELI